MAFKGKYTRAAAWAVALIALPISAVLAQDDDAPAPPAATAAAASGANPSIALSAKVGPFLQKNCSACHSEAIASGDVNLQGLVAAPTSLTTWRETWQEVASALGQGQMPPAGAPKPAKADVDATVAAIKAALALAATPALGATPNLVAQKQTPVTPDWLTFSYDEARTGWNRAETKITKATAPKLQLLWKMQTGTVPNPVNKYSTLTEPLVVNGISTASGVRDLVIVGSRDDSLYAIDKQKGTIVWKRNYPNTLTPKVPASGNCPENMNATPVVDKAKGMVYFLTNDGMLRGVNIADGADKFPATQLVPAFSRNFSLNLANDRIFTSTARGCAGAASEIASIDVAGPNHEVNHFFTSPGKGSGPWGRGGIVHSPFGWLGQTADGAYDPAGGRWGMTLVGLDDNDSVEDSFTMPDEFELDARDLDYGSSSPIVFPYEGRSLVATTSKSGIIYLSDAFQLGGRDHRSTLYTSPRFSNDANVFGFNGAWSVSSTYVDAKGKRWLFVPFYGPAAKATVGLFKKQHGETVNGEIMAFTVEGPGDRPTLQPQWVSADLDLPGVVTVANGVLLVLANGDRGSTLVTGAARRPGGGGGANTPRAAPLAMVNPNAPGAADDQAWWDSQFRPYDEGGQQGGKRFSGGRDTTHAVLYAMDPATGDEIYNSGNAIDSWNHYGELALSDGMVFTTTYDGQVFAFGLKK